MFFSLFAKMIYCSAGYRPVLPIDRLWVVKCRAFPLWLRMTINILICRITLKIMNFKCKGRLPYPTLSLIGRYDLFEDRFDVGIESHFLIRRIQDEVLMEIRGEPDIE